MKKSITRNKNTHKKLVLYFRKINASQQLNNKKVIIMVKTNVKTMFDGQIPGNNNLLSCQNQDNQNQNMKQQVFQISYSRTIKNGTACFFGQAIELGSNVKNINLIVYSIQQYQKNTKNNKNILAQFHVPHIQILQIQSQHKFQSQSNNLTLIWEACFENKNQNVLSNYQDRSLDDFRQLENVKQINIGKQILGRKTYSPVLRGSRVLRRDSIYLRVQKKRRNLISQSPHKNTIETNESLKRTKKNMKLQQQNKIIKQQIIKKSPQKHIKQEQIKNSNKKMPDANANANKQLNQIKNKKQNMRLNQPQSVNYKQKQLLKKMPKNKNKPFQTINYKYLIYAGIVGVIGGIAAAQY